MLFMSTRSLNVVRSYSLWIMFLRPLKYGDITMLEVLSRSQLLQEDDFLEDSIASDWGEIRDDSALVSMLDSQDLEDMSYFMDTDNDTSHSLSNVTLGNAGD